MASALLLVAACGPAPASPTAAPAPKQLDVVSVAGSNVFTSTGFLHIAEVKGYLREQGIEVQYSPVTRPDDVAGGVISGTLDVASTTYTPGIFNSAAKGSGARLTVGTTTYSPGHGNGGFVIRNDLKDQIKEVKDLRGRKVAICSRGSGCEFLGDLFLAKGGLTSRDVEYVVLGFTEVGPAISNNAVDVGIVQEPTLTVGLQKGVYSLFMPSYDIYPAGYTSSGYYYSGKFRTERKDVADRFTVAMVKGLRDWIDAFVHNGPDRKQVIDLMVAKTDIKDPSLYDQMQIPDVDPDGTFNRQAIEMNLHWMQEKGLLQQPLKAEDVWDNSFVEYAKAQLGPYKPPTQR